MNHTRGVFGCLLLLPGLLAVVAAAQPTPTPPATAVRVPRFEADTSQVPQLQPWGRAAEALCATWYPKVVAILRSDDSERPLADPARIVFEKDMQGVAYATGNRIHISARWVTEHPNDFGMVIHELTHLVQRYPRNRAGWLVEGIADYVRLKHFEPQLPLPRINFARARHTDSYKTTAQFLIWLEAEKGADVVPRLHAALRGGRYTDALFKEIAGKEVEALWADFAAAAAPQ
jgi:hypothetical protein